MKATPHRRRGLTALAGFWLFALIAHAQSGNPFVASIGILKGPSGIGATWLVAQPPQSDNVAFRFILAGSADVVTAKLVSGEIVACVLPVNVAAKLYNSGVPLQALAVVGNGMVRFLTTDPSISTIRDIAGKEVQIAGQKATPDYLFRFLADKAGLSAGKEYTVSYNLQYPETALALATGKIKSAILPEPFATQARQLSSDIREPFDLGLLWTKASGRADYPMSIFVVSAKFKAAYPEAVRSLYEAYNSSISKTLSEPAATALKAESLDLGTKAAIAQQAIPRSAYTFVDARFSRPEIEAMLSLFLAFDPQSIGGRLPDEQFFGNRF